MKIFGPVNVTVFNKNTKSNVDRNNNIETIWKEEKELMIRGRNRIIKKVKDTCLGMKPIHYQEYQELFFQKSHSSSKGLAPSGL